MKLSRVSPAALVLWLVLTVFVVSAAAGCGGGGADVGSPSPSPSADAVVARVDGRDVHQSDVDLAAAEARLVGTPDAAADALQTAIDGVLIGAEAERLGIAADKAEVDRRLAAVRDQMGGQAALDAALARTKMTLAQFRTSLAQGIVREGVEDARFPKVKAAAGKVRAFYRRNREKLFTEPAAVELNAFVVRNEGIAGNALKRLRQGRPFAEVARQFSKDPELRDSAGAMGWVTLSSLPAPLRAAVARLNVGETTPPTQGPGGVWVMQLADSRPRTVMPFAEARTQIQDGLDGQLRSAALAQWLEKARKAAQVEKF